MSDNCMFYWLANIISKVCKIPQPLEISGVDCNVNCDIPQPLQVEGNISTNIDIPQPLQVSGTINSNITGTITANIPQPLQITGTINTVFTDSCAEAMAKILGQSTSFNEIILQNGEQFQNAEDVTVNGSIVTFTSQNQKVQTTLCNIEYVVT